MVTLHLNIKTIILLTIKIGIVLSCFQNISFEIGSSQSDLAVFFLPIILFLFYCSNKSKMYISKLILLLIFLSLILINGLNDINEFFRFLGNSLILLTIGIFFTLSNSNQKDFFSQSDINSLLNFVFIWSTLIGIGIIYESFLYADRPKLFFYEPSGAGLYLASFLSSIIVRIYTCKTNKILIAMLIITTIGLLLTKSMHVFSLILFLIFFHLFNKFSVKLVFSLVIVLIIFFIIADFSHYFNRFNVDETSNLSLLSWLRGFDQMKAALYQNPFIGMGVGSTGGFDFKSNHHFNLDQQGYPDLNLKDAFSGFFRLVIEIGLFGTIIFLYFFLQNTRKVFLMATYPSNIILFSFGFTMLIGILLKEPNFARSFIFLVVIFVIFIPNLILNQKR